VALCLRPISSTVGILALMLLTYLLSPTVGAESTNVDVVRSTDTGKVAPGERLNVSLSVSVSEDINAIIVTEELPLGFNIETSWPFFSKHDPVVGNVSWLFYDRTGVDNVTITYIVNISTDISEGIYYINGSWSALGPQGILRGESLSIEIRVERLDSILSLSVSPLKVKVGESITILGSVSPTLSDVNITLTYLKPDGSAFEKEVTTSPDGEFVDNHKVDAAGSWSVTARWPGNSGYKGAKSPEVSFIGETLTEGWQTFTMIFIILISISSVALFSLRRRRSAQPMCS